MALGGLRASAFPRWHFLNNHIISQCRWWSFDHLGNAASLIFFVGLKSLF